MPKIDLGSIPQTNATGYGQDYAAPVRDRWYRQLAPATGLQDFGATHVVLKPGAWSSQRHWHEGEDEILVMISGTAVLIDDHGETDMRPGDIAVFPKGDGNGHHLVNRSDADCAFVAVGKPSASDCHYPDIDMHLFDSIGHQTRKDGSEF